MTSCLGAIFPIGVDTPERAMRRARCHSGVARSPVDVHIAKSEASESTARYKAFAGAPARKHSGVQWVQEGEPLRRFDEIVGWHIHHLHRGDALVQCCLRCLLRALPVSEIDWAFICLMCRMDFEVLCRRPNVGRRRSGHFVDPYRLYDLRTERINQASLNHGHDASVHGSRVRPPRDCCRLSTHRAFPPGDLAKRCWVVAV